MATFDKYAQFIIRVEFHGAKDAPDVYAIFHKELAENIFHDQYYNRDAESWHDLPRATYYTAGTFTKHSVMGHAQDVVNRSIAQAVAEEEGVVVNADIFVIEGAEPHPILTNKPAVAKRPRLK
jgi:hypothetical protein